MTRAKRARVKAAKAAKTAVDSPGHWTSKLRGAWHDRSTLSSSEETWMSVYLSVHRSSYLHIHIHSCTPLCTHTHTHTHTVSVHSKAVGVLGTETSRDTEAGLGPQDGPSPQKREVRHVVPLKGSIRVPLKGSIRVPLKGSRRV